MRERDISRCTKGLTQGISEMDKKKSIYCMFHCVIVTFTSRFCNSHKLPCTRRTHQRNGIILEITGFLCALFSSACGRERVINCLLTPAGLAYLYIRPDCGLMVTPVRMCIQTDRLNRTEQKSGGLCHLRLDTLPWPSGFRNVLSGRKVEGC